jgi:hypothetical protein
MVYKEIKAVVNLLKHDLLSHNYAKNKSVAEVYHISMNILSDPSMSQTFLRVKTKARESDRKITE